MEKSGGYNPYEHRNVLKPTSNLETFIHLLKGCLGTGILAMPDAFKNSGLVMGTIGTILMGIISTYAIHILLRCQYTLCQRMEVPQLTFPEAMKIALETGPQRLRCLARTASVMVDFFIILYQFGICCVYVVFVSNSLKEILDYYWMKIDVRIIMIAVTIPFILLSLTRNLKVLSPVSSIANVITFIGLGFIIYYIFWPEVPNISSVPLFGKPLNFALFFGTILFALQAIAIVITLEANMATPEAFLGHFGVLNQGMCTVTLLYLTFGFIGYVKYGENIKGSISLNLPHTEFIAQGVIIAFAVAIYFSFALQYYVMFDIAWNTWLKNMFDESHLIIYEYMMRVVFVLLAVMAGLAIPLLSLFISLFGSLCLPTLGFAFPALVELGVVWTEEEKSKLTIIKDIALIIFAILSTLISITITLIEIIKALTA